MMRRIHITELFITDFLHLGPTGEVRDYLCWRLSPTTITFYCLVPPTYYTLHKPTSHRLQFWIDCSDCDDVQNLLTKLVPNSHYF